MLNLKLNDPHDVNKKSNLHFTRNYIQHFSFY